MPAAAAAPSTGSTPILNRKTATIAATVSDKRGDVERRPYRHVERQREQPELAHFAEQSVEREPDAEVEDHADDRRGDRGQRAGQRACCRAAAR